MPKPIKTGKQDDGSVVSLLHFTKTTKRTVRFDAAENEEMPVRNVYIMQGHGIDANTAAVKVTIEAVEPDTTYT